MTIQLSGGRLVALAGDQIDSTHLDHAYAVTVHRMQGATVDRAHVLAGGEGRELAYVAMRRARQRSCVYTVAANADEAVEDIAASWRIDARQRWTIDLDQPTAPGGPTRPDPMKERIAAFA